MALVCGKGAIKYDDDNWRKGYSFRLGFGAMQRHIHLFWMGDNYDEETGLHHLLHAAWHCMTLFTFSIKPIYTKFDDRPDRDVSFDMIEQVRAELREIKEEIRGCCAPSIFNDTAKDIASNTKVNEYYGLDEIANGAIPEQVAVEQAIDRTHNSQAPAGTDVASNDPRVTKTEAILGHMIQFIDDKCGYIDGVYLQGTAFTAPVKRYRNGHETVDDAMEAAYARDAEKEA